MTTLLGTVVVENQGGGGSSLGAAAAARADPDGYTVLLAGPGALVVNTVAASRPLYDPVRDFEPIALMVRNTFAIIVHPSLPVQTLAELIDYARKNPGKLSYGSAGVGSLNHLTGELLKSLTGTADIVHVPYRGAAPAIADLISGQIPMAMPSVTRQAIELHRSGKVRMLAVTSQGRLVGAPEIATAVEAGVPGMVSDSFIGLFAPRGTPVADHRADRRGDPHRHGRPQAPAALHRIRLRAFPRFEPGKDAAHPRGSACPLDAGHQVDRPQAQLSCPGHKLTIRRFGRCNDHRPPNPPSPASTSAADAVAAT